MSTLILLTILAHAHKIKEPNIYLGGMVTIIALKAGIDLDHLIEVEPGLMDYEYLQKCRILKNVGSKSSYVFWFMSRDKTNQTFKLSATDLTKVKMDVNIRFEYKGDLEGGDGEALMEQPKDEEEDEEGEVDGDEEDQSSNIPPLPELPFKPKGARELILTNAFKAQNRGNKWLINMVNKHHRNLKKTLVHVSSEEEDEEASEEGDDKVEVPEEETHQDEL